MTPPRTDTDAALDAVIVGAGIGGLTACIALERVGIQAFVVDRRRDVERLELGGGVVLWPNGTAALGRLALLDATTAAGQRITRFEIRAPGGRLLAAPPVAAIERSHRAPTIALTRAALFGVLRAVIPGDRLVLGREVTGFSQSGEDVIVAFRGGTFRTRLLIGADGKASTIRGALGAGRTGFPPYAGFVLWRGIARDVPEPDAGKFTIAQGCGVEAYYFRLDERRVYWAVARYGPPRGAALALGESLRDEVGPFVERWALPLGRLIAATEGGDMTRSDMHGGEPLPRWGEQRVTLLGDAAHPMTTTLGQGACQTIEDAVVLAEALSEKHDAPDALRAYEERRRPRTFDVMRVAGGFERPNRSRNPILCWFRDRGIGLLLGSPSRIRRTGYWRVMTATP